MSDTLLSRAYYDSARVVFEALLDQSPDPLWLSDLALVYAETGSEEEALQLARRAVAALPLSKDAFGGTRHVLALAMVAVLVDEPEVAIEQLEVLLSVPSPVSTALLRVDPLWDTLRDHPRFQALLAKYEN